MDDSRIQQLTDEVLAAIREDREKPSRPDLESRIASLEREVAELRGALARGATATVTTASLAATTVRVHPSLQVLKAGARSERCVMEPDKPCVESHACRTFGH
ncbi:MAG TPA: hypothetical protein VJU18_11330 [Vicinamibacteria bacterium]|nr:hypothetical protein [Vicinamibacteria bacterium]